MKKHFILLAVAVGAMSACTTTSSDAPAIALPTAEMAMPENPLELGRELTNWFYSGEMAPIWSKMDDRMRGAMGSEQNLDAFRQQVEAQLGTETNVVDEQMTAAPPYQVYVRTASFSNYDQPITVQWTFDESGKVSGFFVKPAQ